MKFKKTTLIGVIFSLALVLALTAAFASEPKQPDEDSTTFSMDSARVWSMTADADSRLENFTIDLDCLEKNLAQHVADGTMTQEEADRVMALAREAAVDGELHWTFPADSGLVLDHFDANGEYRPGFNVFYKSPDGNTFPVDPATVVSGFIFPAGSTGSMDTGPVTPSGFDSVKYFPMPLDAFLGGLAQEVETGNMTQAEADQRVADLLALMGLNSLSDIKVPDGEALIVSASRHDYFVGGYAYILAHVEGEYFEDTPGVLGQLIGEGHIEYDTDTHSDDYYSIPPTLDENGSWVAADGSIVGTANDTVPSPAPTSPVVIPDLNSEMIPAKATNGKEGYIRHSDTLEGQYGPVNTPEEAAKYMEWLSTQPSSFTIPVYDEAGNVIGEFPMTNSAPSSPYATPSPSTSSASYPVCTVSGCTIPGSHTHNGVNYACNGFHSGGHCDGSCTSYSTTYPSTNSGHHSESHHGSGHH